jgi:aspartyl-tRNA(Asn)/glutamyl-tRNA(Gln) amidotransferase subunit B
VTWEIVVGMETHAQLATKSKMFSGAATAFGAPPNSQACAVDIALPGVLPVANAAAVEMAVKFGLAVGGRINARSVFARKNYFYPDLPKGYQISQYEIPIVAGGTVKFAPPGGEKTVRLTRAHLEEDAGKSLHEDYHGLTGIDLNRAGTPLLEIVSEPELRGAQEAVAYARALHALVRWIGVCDGNMQEGSFRCDANVSVRRVGDAKLGTRCEIKNLNSFLFMEQAIEFEARRQIGLLEDGGTVVQETRLFDPDKGETRAMRTKEEAHDYRYFPDPDLLPLVLQESDVERIRGTLTDTPDVRRTILMAEYGLAGREATLVVQSREFADFFSGLVDGVRRLLPTEPKEKCAKYCANWMIGDLAAALNRSGVEMKQVGFGPAPIAVLLARVVDGTISARSAKEIFDGVWEKVYPEPVNVDKIIEEKGLRQISDTGSLEKIIDEVLAQNARQVGDYRAGKDKAFNSLVGQVMKATQGKANPAQVNELLKAKLAR